MYSGICEVGTNGYPSNMFLDNINAHDGKQMSDLFAEFFSEVL